MTGYARSPARRHNPPKRAALRRADYGHYRPHLDPRRAQQSLPLCECFTAIRAPFSFPFVPSKPPPANDTMRPDFSRMGTVALVGAFTGVDTWPPTAPSSPSPAAAAIVGGNAFRAPAPGTVDAVCVMAGVTYLGGRFDALALVDDDDGGTEAPAYTGVAAWDGAQLRPLAQGIEGNVRALLCDEATRRVYVGGEFDAPVGQSGDAYRGNVAVWDVDAAEWRAPAFGGVAGRVEVIAQTGQAFLFGGTFQTFSAAAAGNGTNTTLWNTTLAPANGTGVYLNTTTSSLPSSPLGTLGTADSPYLLPLPLRTPISAIDAGPSTSDPSHSDPSNLLCAGGDAWWVRDGSVGKVTVNLYRTVRARGVRLGNVADGRGTTRFRYALPPFLARSCVAD